MKEYKVCKKCGENKRLIEYSRNSKLKDGRQGACKECYSRLHRERRGSLSPVEKSIQSMANNMHKRTSPNGEYAVKGILNLIGNIPEIKQFLADNFTDDIQAIIDAGKKPSMDRIDSNDNYKAGNIQVISVGENAARANEDRSKDRWEGWW